METNPEREQQGWSWPTQPLRVISVMMLMHLQPQEVPPAQTAKEEEDNDPKVPVQWLRQKDLDNP